MTRAQAIVLREHGGPDALRPETVDIGVPCPDELLIRQTAAGVNFHDIYVRTGLYRTLALPGVPGIEGAGVVEAVGSEVEAFRPGDRIGYVSPEYGGYASMRLLPASRAFRLPPFLTDVGAAASLLKALTVRMLIREVHLVQPGQTILIHAAAGGVGQLLCSWASALGAVVIGTVGNEKKAEVAIRSGARHAILYREEDFVERVRDITGGQGVAAVYDSVGQDTFLKSLECLDYRGILVNFGQSSGAVGPFSPALLAARSTSVSRPILFHFLRVHQEAQAMFHDVVEAFEKGLIAPLEAFTMPLADAPKAHRVLESGASPGGIILVP